MDPVTPACVIERGTMPEQRRIDATLSTVTDVATGAQVRSPAILVVGDVCGLAPELDWYDALPLRGKTVAVTRPRGRSHELMGRLRALGARVLEVPLIETRPVPVAELVPVARGLEAYAWLVLTSTEGVRCLHAALGAAGLDARALAGVRLAAIGPATSRALAGMGLAADLVPDVYDTAHLGRALLAALAPGGRALLFRSRQGSRELTRILDEGGVSYDDVAAYDTVTTDDVVAYDTGAADKGAAVRLADEVLGGKVDVVTLTSPSCAEALEAALAKAGAVRVPDDCALVCLGGATASSAAALGGRLAVAKEATVDALVDAVLEALA